MEPAAGFEPATYGLQNRCSTAELNRHGNTGARGRVRTSEGIKPPVLQTGAFDHFATLAKMRASSLGSNRSAGCLPNYFTDPLALISSAIPARCSGSEDPY